MYYNRKRRKIIMYQYKELYTLDFSKVNYLGEVHKVIKEGLDFPDYYGENISALWDCLTDMVDIDDPLHIELLGMERIQHLFPKQTELILKTFKDLKHYDNDYYIEQTKIEIVIGEARYEIH